MTGEPTSPVDPRAPDDPGSRDESADSGVVAELARLRAELDVSRAREAAATAKVEAIQQLGRAIGQTLNLDRLLALVMEKVTELLGADRSTLFLVDEDRHELWSKVAQGPADASGSLEIRVPIGAGAAGWVARTGRTINVKDAYRDRRFDPHTDQRTGYRTRSMIVVPMRNVRGHIIGVVQVLNKRAGYFTVEDENLLHALSNQASISIENSKLYLSVATQNIELLDAQQRLQRKMEQLQVLRAVDEIIGAEPEPERALDRVLDLLCRAIPSAGGGLLLRDRASDQLLFRAATGEPTPAGVVLRLEEGQGFAGWSARTGEPVISDAPREDARHAPALEASLGLTMRSTVAVPVRGRRGPIGAIQLVNRVGGGGRYSEEELELLALVSAQVGRAVQVQRAREDLGNQRRLADIGRAMSTLLHDFKGPATRVSLYVQEMVSEPDVTERGQLASLAERDLRELHTMTRDVLDFASGRVNLLPQRVYLGEVLQDLEERMARELQAKDIALQTEFDYRGPIRIDASKIQRALWNLVRNAQQAMPDGGTLTLRAWRDGDFAVIRIADTGCGIPAEIRDRLFDAFVTSGKRDGTGLGLAMVDRVVREHGGAVSFDSEIGVGTAFEVRLPLAGPPSHRGEAAQEPARATVERGE